jgi:hypothetical protein
VLVKRLITSFAVVAVAFTLADCRGREKAATSDGTETIAPAQPQPASSETDAMTQTVDIEDSRSEDDGASLTAGSTGTANPTTTTATTKATTTHPTAAPRKPPKKQ